MENKIEQPNTPEITVQNLTWSDDRPIVVIGQGRDRIIVERGCIDKLIEALQNEKSPNNGATPI
jgi:hypothetical protein